MKIKSIITIALLLISVVAPVNAKEINETPDYYVYSIIGVVKEVKGRISSELSVRQSLFKSSVITIGKNSQLVIIDPANSKQHTLSTPGTSTIARMIGKSSNSTKDLTKMYLSYMMKQIQGKGVLTSQRAINDVGGAIERDTEDSLFVDFELPDSLLEKE